MSIAKEKEEIMRVVYCEACDMYEVEWNGNNSRCQPLNSDENVAEAIKVIADTMEDLEQLEVILGAYLMRDIMRPHLPH